jgi:quercetin dioxygenase-like cupin family protein
MTTEPTVVDADEREWESWPPNQVAERGDVAWKTLVSRGQTNSRGLTLGVARLDPGGVLRRHRHAQDEIYFVVEGTGVVTVDGARHAVRPGAGVFLPGHCAHSIECTGETALRFAYVLAADSFADVEYVFGD